MAKGTAPRVLGERLAASFDLPGWLSAGGSDFEVAFAGADGDIEVKEEAFEPGQAEWLRPCVAEPDGGVPGGFAGAVGDGEVDAGEGSCGPDPADVEVLGQSGGQVDAGDR